ncbi:MAG: hypothetical protein ACTSYI_04930 [Promethearchaeota archaeon]
MTQKTHGILFVQATLIVSASLFLLSGFVPLAGEYSILQLFILLHGNPYRLIYLIPWICSGSLLLIGPFLHRWLRIKRIYLYILLILILNLEIVLINEVFQQHGSYVWQNTCIYLLIGAVACYILGFLQLLTVKSPQFDEET